jgi:hypothetical protein
MTEAAEEGRPSTEPLLDSVHEGEDGDENNTENDGTGTTNKPHLLLIFSTATFRSIFSLFYLLPCRPQNHNNGFVTSAERGLFISAPSLFMVSIMIEVYAHSKTTNNKIKIPIYASAILGTILIFVAGIIYANESIVDKDDHIGDAFWVIGGFLLSLSYGYDAIHNFRMKWTMIGISKLFAFFGSVLFMLVGTVGPIGSIDVNGETNYDFFKFRNYIFSGSLFYLFHSFLLLIGQKVNVIFVRMDE